MKLFAIILALFALSLPVVSEAAPQVPSLVGFGHISIGYVRGHLRSGHYVRPYYRR